MEPHKSPWVRRALAGRLPTSLVGGISFTREDEVGITPAAFGPDAWSAQPGARAAVPIEIEEMNPVCVCGEIHRGWQHRDPAER